jgi:hypothetical protein
VPGQAEEEEGAMSNVKKQKILASPGRRIRATRKLMHDGRVVGVDAFKREWVSDDNSYVVECWFLRADLTFLRGYVPEITLTGGDDYSFGNVSNCDAADKWSVDCSDDDNECCPLLELGRKFEAEKEVAAFATKHFKSQQVAYNALLDCVQSILDKIPPIRQGHRVPGPCSEHPDGELVNCPTLDEDGHDSVLVCVPKREEKPKGRKK